MFRILKFIARFGLLLLALTGVSLYQGCNSSVEKQVALAKLAETCLINTDCTSPLVCAFEACHEECASSRDCDKGARCVSAARPYKVCQLKEERDCKHTPDCPEGLVCGVDGQCRDTCQIDADCVEAQVCVSGTCADKNELDAQGQLTPAAGVTSGAEGTPCVYVSDCSGALLCRSQACVPECRSDRDCGDHRVCQDTRCVDDGTQPASCNYNSDCDAKSGQRCFNGSCRCGCVENRDCPGGQICDGCGCVIDPSIQLDCTYNSDCKKPGEVCKSGSCACQCQKDGDCGDGQKCDGCGCVDARAPNGDGVIAGDVTITSSLELSIYRGVKIIQGALNIHAPELVDLGDTFDQLEGITGVFSIDTNPLLTHLAFPKLKTAGVITIGETDRLLSVDLPLLETANVVNLQSAGRLESLALPVYQSGSIDIAVGLAQLELPALQHSPTFSVHDSPYLQSISAPALLDVTTLRLATLQHLTQASAPKLHVFTSNTSLGDLVIQQTALTSIAELLGSIDAKFSLNGLTITFNSALSQCDVTAFQAAWVLSTKLPAQLDGNEACP